MGASRCHDVEVVGKDLLGMIQSMSQQRGSQVDSDMVEALRQDFKRAMQACGEELAEHRDILQKFEEPLQTRMRVLELAAGDSQTNAKDSQPTDAAAQTVVDTNGIVPRGTQ